MKFDKRWIEEMRIMLEAAGQRIQFDDSERLKFKRMHPRWMYNTAGTGSHKAYGSQEYVHYFIDENDAEPVLYRSTRNVPINSPPPNVTVNPSNWIKIG